MYKDVIKKTKNADLTTVDAIGTAVVNILNYMISILREKGVISAKFKLKIDCQPAKKAKKYTDIEMMIFDDIKTLLAIFTEDMQSHIGAILILIRCINDINDVIRIITGIRLKEITIWDEKMGDANIDGVEYYKGIMVDSWELIKK